MSERGKLGFWLCLISSPNKWVTTKYIKRDIRAAPQTGSLRAHLDYISSQLALLTETEDHAEATNAFLEKRKPSYTGN